jgi:CO/xanthine dehydrogenase FAD-binding subunit
MSRQNGSVAQDDRCWLRKSQLVFLSISSMVVMKAAPFEYSRPTTIDEACALLAANDDARVIAGGQTLVPMMAMRLARPAQLIDISRIPETAVIHNEGDAIIVGATTRQAVAERSALVRVELRLLAKALPWVGHAATRARGTFGGSVANADPAAEIPLVLVALGGTVVLHDANGTYDIAAKDFFVGPMMTSMPAGSCITALRFPCWRGHVGTGFHELSARRCDFALAAAAAQVALDAEGRCTACAVAIGGATPTPMLLEDAAEALIGSPLANGAIADALSDAIAALEIMTDPYGTPEFRRRAAAKLAHRALTDARADALGRIGERA